MAELSPVSSNEARPKDSGTPRIRRRNRMITSCLECRRRKLKCDKLHPCTNCSKFARDCMFLAPALDSVSQKKLNELKDKMGSLEKVLENDIARRGDKRSGSPNGRTSSGDLPGEESSGSDREIFVPEDEKPLEQTPLAVTDAAYEDTTNEDLLDLGVRLGRMRLTERFGGTFRPRFAEELASALNEPINTNMQDPSIRRLSDHEDFLSPGPTFIAPGSGFVFGDVGPRRNLIDFLPSKAAADTLIQKYYRNVHFVARVVHWPSFQLQYESFWNNVLSGYEPQPSLQVVVFAILFSAVASMGEDEIFSLFGSNKTSIQTNFQTATEVSLGKAHYLRTTKIETLQGLVIYLIPMVRESISRAHSVLVGSALRLAECMGLHRDPSVFGMSPIGSHVRRILWFQLCFLDFRTSETQAPRPYIKREDYDTRFPMDINDLDLMSPEPKEREGVWTDMTLSRLRFECCEMWRIVNADTDRLRRKKASITHTLSKIESFRRAMESKYYPMIDTNVPIQAYARHFLGSAMARMHVTVLHRFHHSVHVHIPDRLREILIVNAVESMEHFITLQKVPAFQDWRWYTTSITTWNPAMLLLLEVFIFPNRREADRIWAILDFVYQPDLQLTRDEKARQTLRTIRDRIAFYRDMRQIREPVNMPKRMTLTFNTRDSRNSVSGPGSILLKTEDDDSPLPSSNTSTNGELSRKTSLTDAPVDRSGTNGLSKTRSVESDGWTFDHQSTLFVSKNASRLPSVSPVPPGVNGIAQRSSIAQTMNTLPGLDYGHSPGSSSTNTDAWPPAITNDQVGWNIANSPPQKPQLDTTIDRRISTMQMPTDQMSNMYAPHGFAPNQLQYTAGGQQNFVSMLQPANHGYIPDESMSLDIDWGEWDKIFPPNVNTGNLDQPRTSVG